MYCRALPGERTFLRWVYDSMGSLPQHHHVNVGGELKKDLKVWVDLLDNHEQGTPFLQTNIMYSEEIKFYTNAVGSEKCGWGCVFDDE